MMAKYCKKENVENSKSHDKPVVASGNLVLRIDTSVTPVTVDKIFGLVGRDHSVYKFRLIIDQCQANQTFGFQLLNLSEESLDCIISLDVCDERKNKAKNQMVLVLREENVLLKNMTSYYQERECLDENQNSKHMEVSLGLEIAQDLVPNHLSMMRRLARKFNDKSTSDFIVKSQDKKFHVHQIILSERSEFFDAMFRSELFESKTNSLEIPDAEPKVVGALLRYLYNDAVLFSDVTIDLMTIADKYDLKALFNRCDFYIAQALRSCQLTGEDVKEHILTLMEAVDRFRAPKLTAAILEWKVRGDIGDDFDKMWFDFINEHDDFAKMIAISACIQERQDKVAANPEFFVGVKDVAIIDGEYL